MLSLAPFRSMPPLTAWRSLSVNASGSLALPMSMVMVSDLLMNCLQSALEARHVTLICPLPMEVGSWLQKVGRLARERLIVLISLMLLSLVWVGAPLGLSPPSQ